MKQMRSPHSRPAGVRLGDGGVGPANVGLANLMGPCGRRGLLPRNLAMPLARDGDAEGYGTRTPPAVPASSPVDEVIKYAVPAVANLTATDCQFTANRPLTDR